MVPPEPPSGCRAPPGLAPCARFGPKIRSVLGVRPGAGEPGTTRLTSRRRHPGSCTGTANTVPSNKSAGPPIIRCEAARCHAHKRTSPKTYPFERPTDNRVYSTLRQEQSENRGRPNTVLSRKNLPYRPTNSCSLRRFSGCTAVVLPTKSLQIARFNVARPRRRIYRTLRQALPYPATNLTVLCHKLYRTVRQGIPYSPTSFTVLCRKNMAYPATKAARDVPAKRGK